jgi:ribosomal subunit interface protein
MRIDIKTHKFSLTDALRTHTKRRLHYALGGIDEPIQRVIVRLSDVNGPRGGKDKRCRLQLVLSGLPDVIVNDTQSDLYVAIDRASDRARRSLLRRLQQHKANKNRLGRRLFMDSAEPAYS